MAVIVKNTFIDVFDASASHASISRRRSSSEPPGSSPKEALFEENFGEESAAQGGGQACSSPRSEYSTAASSIGDIVEATKLALHDDKDKPTASACRAAASSIESTEATSHGADSPRSTAPSSSHSTEAYQICVSKMPETNDPNASELSLCQLLPGTNRTRLTSSAAAFAPTLNGSRGSTGRELSSAAPEFIPSCSIGEERAATKEGRQKLTSAAPAFAPNFDASCGSTGREQLVTSEGSHGEMSEILKSVAQALTFNSEVQGIQVMENELGASAAIYIELRPKRPSASQAKTALQPRTPSQVVSSLAKSALIHAAEQSERTYLVGYLGEPFLHIGDSSFKATLALMRSSERACWDFYGKGKCAHRGACRWRHPSADDLMDVWINLQQPASSI